jgi:hypothetical protein
MRLPKNSVMEILVRSLGAKQETVGYKEPPQGGSFFAYLPVPQRGQGLLQLHIGVVRSIHLSSVLRFTDSISATSSIVPRRSFTHS